MKDIESIISKQLSGKELSSGELASLKNWKNQSDKNSQIYNTISGYWRKEGFQNTESKKRVWNTVYSEVKGNGNSENNIVHNDKFVKLNWLPKDWIKYAASISLILISVFSYLYINSKLTEEEYKSATQTYPVIEKVIPKGQKTSLKLSDGSSVKVNSASRIFIPEKFEKEKRLVRLEGEAFFQVTKNKHRPFIIKTGEVETLVVGTAFNISSFQDQNYIEVAVAEGIVEVSKKEDHGIIKKMTLKEGEKGVFLKKTGEFIKKATEESDFAWKDDTIILNKVSFEEMVDVLERWYGLEFSIKRKITFEKGISGNFKGENIKNVLESLSYTGGFSYSIQDGKVEIY